MRLAWCAALLAVLGVLPAHARDPRVGPGHEVPGHYWIDVTGKAPFEAARAAFDAGRGRPDEPSKVMPFGSGVAVWYRVPLPTVAQPWRAVLEVPYAGMDEVELYARDGSGRWTAQRSGDSVAVSHWPMQYLHPAFALTVPPQDTELYLRVRNRQDTRVTWLLWDVNSFSGASKLWHLALGAYAGFMVLVVLLSLLHVYSWRDSIHAYYAVHVVLIGLTIMAITGLGGEYLWPDAPWWTDKAPLVLPAVSLAWMGLFVRELVVERGRPFVSWALLAHVAVSVAAAATLMAVGRESLFAVPSVYTVPSMALILGVLGWYASRRPQVGGWVLAGWLALAAGSILPMLRNFGVLPLSFATQYGLQIGGAVEIPLVLVGIYFRSRERRDNLVRLAALARTDPLTGLASHRLLASRLADLLRRSRREPALGAILRVRVANLERIRTEHGREAAEAALLQAAECIAREASEGDTVGREESGDLVLVLEGRATREQVGEAARNIIARGLKFSARLPPQVTLSLRIAGACAPLPQLEAATLLEMLDKMLDRMLADPRARPLRIVDANGVRPSAAAPLRASGGEIVHRA